MRQQNQSSGSTIALDGLIQTFALQDMCAGIAVGVSVDQQQR